MTPYRPRIQTEKKSEGRGTAPAVSAPERTGGTAAVLAYQVEAGGRRPRWRNLAQPSRMDEPGGRVDRKVVMGADGSVPEGGLALVTDSSRWAGEGETSRLVTLCASGPNCFLSATWRKKAESGGDVMDRNDREEKVAGAS